MSEIYPVASTEYCKPNPPVEHTQPSITIHILMLSSNYISPSFHSHQMRSNRLLK
jgi:hypothetical protein